MEKGVLALGGELHADADAALLARGSEQKDLWGVNLYPDKKLEDWIEYIALINIRPATGNRSMEIKDPQSEARYRRSYTASLDSIFMTPVHKTLSSAKWQSMGLNEQLANIGSEVGRMIHWQRVRDAAQTDRALERALELIDLTLEDKR